MEGLNIGNTLFFSNVIDDTTQPFTYEHYIQNLQKKTAWKASMVLSSIEHKIPMCMFPSLPLANSNHNGSA